MKLSDLNIHKRRKYKFRTQYRITIRVSEELMVGRGEENWFIGINDQAKALRVLAFLEELVETDPNFLSVSMKHDPHRKGGTSHSTDKKRRLARRWRGVDGACPDLANILNRMFD